MNIQANISNSLKAYRKRNELSQEALAESLGVTSQAVSKWECMQSIPDIETVVAIAEMLGISTDKLLLGRDFSESGLKDTREESSGVHNKAQDEKSKAKEMGEIQFNGKIMRCENGSDGVEVVIKVQIPSSAEDAEKNKSVFTN